MLDLAGVHENATQDLQGMSTILKPGFYHGRRELKKDCELGTRSRCDDDFAKEPRAPLRRRAAARPVCT